MPSLKMENDSDFALVSNTLEMKKPQSPLEQETDFARIETKNRTNILVTERGTEKILVWLLLFFPFQIFFVSYAPLYGNGVESGLLILPRKESNHTVGSSDGTGEVQQSLQELRSGKERTSAALNDVIGE